MKNILIGYGESLTENINVKSGSGKKKHPYSFAEARERFIDDMTVVLENARAKPTNQCANGEVVIQFLQHPSYLAKSYYPNKLFKRFGLRDVGSKAVTVKPTKWAIKEPPEEGLASCVFVSGTPDKFEAMLNAVTYEALPETAQTSIRTLEKTSTIDVTEKVKAIDKGKELLKLEVVLHASKSDSYIRQSFEQYATSIEAIADWTKVKIVGGLTFLPVSISSGNEFNLAAFSHLRALRSVPKLRINRPDLMRTSFATTFALPEFIDLQTDFEVCIFDGGLGDNTVISQWANEIVPADIKGSHPKLLSHGSEVCSTYLFGPYDEKHNSLSKPYTKIDIVRVLSPTETDPDLFDVLARIEQVLSLKKYKYVNISLGPRLSIDDDDVHVWTSVLDNLLQDGHCLATVAIGNDGDLSKELSRIQPPSDMVNCFAVGSSDTIADDWAKAPYSCIGPGRSPGIVKPDGVIFGGSENDLFKIYSPLTHSIIGTMGTSYSAPYAMRVAAGIDAITDFDLSATTVKALLIHNADRKGHPMTDVGWGRLPSSPESVIECLDDEATIVFQGELKKSNHLRIPIPMPNGLDCTWVHLKATFCFNAVTDPEHPLHYTRSGLDISFRANDGRIPEGAEHPETKTFFSVGKLYDTEQELREDAHKWETSISREQRFRLSTLSNPVFDVKYHAREKGGDSDNTLPPLNYSLILSIRAEGDNNVYNMILQQNQTLQTVKVRNRIEVI